MITPYLYKNLGSADHGWLQARHHFSFASYHDPARMQFGTLRVINDDIVAPQTGFATHPHRDMEIITYVRQGAITHRDSEGNEGVTGAGDVQVMSAGRGVYHSEYNLSDVPTNLYQIWITPHTIGVQPRWEARTFPKSPVANMLQPLASGRDADIARGALMIYQDATIAGGRMLPGQKIIHALKHQGYLLVSSGSLHVDGVILHKGDGAAVTDVAHVEITAAESDTELLVIDIPAL